MHFAHQITATAISSTADAVSSTADAASTIIIHASNYSQYQDAIMHVQCYIEHVHSLYNFE